MTTTMLRLLVCCVFLSRVCGDLDADGQQQPPYQRAVSASDTSGSQSGSGTVYSVQNSYLDHYKTDTAKQNYFVPSTTTTVSPQNDQTTSEGQQQQQQEYWWTYHDSLYYSPATTEDDKQFTANDQEDRNNNLLPDTDTTGNVRPDAFDYFQHGGPNLVSSLGSSDKPSPAPPKFASSTMPTNVFVSQAEGDGAADDTLAPTPLKNRGVVFSSDVPSTGPSINWNNGEADGGVFGEAGSGRSDYPSLSPSSGGLNEQAPTQRTTSVASDYPSLQPSNSPSTLPSDLPSLQQSSYPSTRPSNSPSTQPSDFPSIRPSDFPSTQPSNIPSTQPSDLPSTQPSDFPSTQPSDFPSTQPSMFPSTQPSDFPSTQPSNIPSTQPSDFPNTQPKFSATPSIVTGVNSLSSDNPSLQPSQSQSNSPSDAPSIVELSARPSSVSSSEVSAVGSSPNNEEGESTRGTSNVDGAIDENELNQTMVDTRSNAARFGLKSAKHGLLLSGGIGLAVALLAYGSYLLATRGASSKLQAIQTGSTLEDSSECEEHTRSDTFSPLKHSAATALCPPERELTTPEQISYTLQEEQHLPSLDDSVITLVE